METRKLISFGSSSYVISLPKNWISTNRLEKGDSLYVEERQNELVITSGDSDREKKVKEKQIDCGNKKFEIIKCELIAAYLNNYNLIEIRQINENNLIRIKEILQNLAGLEILEQTSDKIIAKDLINIKEVSIKALMRRIDIIIRSMIDDTISKNKNNVQSLYDRDGDVNRLVFLVRRMVTAALEDQKISRMFDTEPKDVLLDAEIALRLEKIGDNLKRIAKCLSNLKLNEKSTDNVSTVFEEIKASYLSVMKAYYNRDAHLACEMETKKPALYVKCDDLLHNGDTANKQFVILIEKLKNANANISDIAKSLMLGCI